jgi:CubicO group peptidase (beta-lactamase class C family)
MITSQLHKILILLLIVPGGPIVASDWQEWPATSDFDSYVAQTMKDFKVPGAAVAIVHDGKVLVAKGYGFRDIENQLPVTTKTLFPIASISKSFTVTTLGIMVDQGVVDWDKPVRDYLPGFRMYDPVATDEMTPRDLVTHRSGLPRHDLVWYGSSFSQKEIVERLRYLEPNKPLRQTFQYNNLMFITAGYLESVLNHSSWQEAVQKLVLTPIGMTGTLFSSAEAQKNSDCAQPYRKNRRTEEVQRIAFAQWGEVGPAGGIKSNLDDMVRYLLFHLAKGKLEGKQLLSENSSSQMQTPQMVVQGERDYQELGDLNYGMGFFISTYRGHKLVEHGGNLDGFSLDFVFLPDDQIGVIVLANLDGSRFRDALPFDIFDQALGLKPLPWNERFVEREHKEEEAENSAEDKGLTGRREGTRPSHDLQEFVGEYSNPGYGLVTIALADSPGDLKFTLNNLPRTVKHFHYDTFAVPPDPIDVLEKLKISFVTDLNGDISTVSIPLEENVKSIVFDRVAEKQMFDKAFLDQFVGDYDFMGRTLSIQISGKNLTATFPGSPVRPLEPRHGTIFNLPSLPGTTIEFKKDESGKFSQLVFAYTDISYLIKRK